MIQVTCAIIIEKGKVLVAQNNENSDHAFQWEFPGGKVKTGETVEDCIVREIQEELNLNVQIEEKLTPVEYDYEIKSIRLIPYVCVVVSGDLKLNDHKDIKWLDLDELTELDWAEADRRLLFEKENLYRLEKYLGK